MKSSSNRQLPLGKYKKLEQEPPPQSSILYWLGVARMKTAFVELPYLSHQTLEAYIPASKVYVLPVPLLREYINVHFPAVFEPMHELASARLRILFVGHFP
jgi:hypothetical protein